MEKGEPIRKCFLNRYRAEKSSPRRCPPLRQRAEAGVSAEAGWQCLGEQPRPGQRQAARRVV